MQLFGEIIKPTAEECGMTASIVADYTTSDIIIKEIIYGILEADLIVADVTGANPNVAYELGIADSFKKDVLILTQDEARVPFDYKHRRFYKYNPNTQRGRTHLRRWLHQGIMASNNKKSQHDVWGVSVSNQAFFKYDSDPLQLLSEILYRGHLGNRYTSSIRAVKMLIIVGQKHSGRASVGFGDNPEFHALAVVIY